MSAAALAAPAVIALGWVHATRGPLVTIGAERLELRLAQLAVPGVTIAAAVLLAAAGWRVVAALLRGSPLRVGAPPSGAAAGAALVAAAVALSFAAAVAVPSLDRTAAGALAFATGADARAGVGATGAPAATSARSPVLHTTARLDAGGPGAEHAGSGVALRMLGVDPATLGTVAESEQPLGGAPLQTVLTVLATNAAAAEEPPLLSGARFVGAWIKLPELRDATTVGVQLRAHTGALLDVPLATVLPGQIPVSEWSFFAAEVPPTARDSTLAAVTVSARGGTGGTLLLRPVVATGAQTVAARGDGGRVPFTGVVVVEEFVDASRWEPLTSTSSDALGVLAPADEAPPGATATARPDWPATPAPRGVARYGLRPGDGAPVLLYLDRASEGALGLAPGDAAGLELHGRRVHAQVAELLDAFPGLAERPGATPEPPGFAIAELSRLRTALGATPAARTVAANEA